jgi:large subunit ribosomal protein L19
MSFALIQQLNEKQKKSAVVDVRTGDTVRVHQKIKEGSKERIQIFEGVVIRTDRKDSLTSRITVRKISNGIGVEKSFLLHSPLVEKVEITKRAKVRRKYLSFLRQRSGKSARLAMVSFNRESVNNVENIAAEAEEQKIRDEKKREAEAKEISEKTKEAELEEKRAEIEARHTK